MLSATVNARTVDAKISFLGIDMKKTQTPWEILMQQLAPIMNQPHVDVKTGKIHGAIKGSWVWWHEKAHIEFNKDPIHSTLRLWQYVLLVFWMVSITFAILNKYMLWLSFPTLVAYVLIDLYEEHWCNQYAKAKMSKKKGL